MEKREEKQRVTGKEAVKRETAKRKTAVVILFIAVSLLFAGCGKKGQDKNADARDTPKDVAEHVMEDLKSLDLEDFNEITDNHIRTYTNLLGVPTSAEYRVFQELLQPGRQKGKHYERAYRLAERIVEKMSWEIKEVREKDNQAEIDMEITNMDMAGVLGKYEISIYENILKSEGSGFWQFTKDMVDLAQDMDGLIDIMDTLDEEDVCTMKVTVSAYQEDGKWKLHISEAFINAFMGNIDAEGYSEELEEKIAELEAQYNEKLDTWEEDFTNKVENWVERNF